MKFSEADFKHGDRSWPDDDDDDDGKRVVGRRINESYLVDALPVDTLRVITTRSNEFDELPVFD